MSLILEPEHFDHKLYFEPCAEFEEIRKLCLSEDNWLRDNWLPENMKLEQYMGMAVLFHKETGEPAAFGGLFNPGRYPKNVAQHLHRMYTFPKFRIRKYTDLVKGFKIYHEHMVKPLNEHNPHEVYFIAMQNRYKKSTKGYWQVFSSAACEGMPGWQLGEGYLQTCTADVQKCYQNFIYCETVEGSFDSWNKNIIDQETWDCLIQGD